MSSLLLSSFAAAVRTHACTHARTHARTRTYTRTRTHAHTHTQLAKVNSADAVKVRQMIFGDGAEKEYYSAGGSGTGGEPEEPNSLFTVDDDYNTIQPFEFPDDDGDDDGGGGGGIAGGFGIAAKKSRGGRSGALFGAGGALERMPIPLHGTDPRSRDGACVCACALV